MYFASKYLNLPAPPIFFPLASFITNANVFLFKVCNLPGLKFVTKSYLTSACFDSYSPLFPFVILIRHC